MPAITSSGISLSAKLHGFVVRLAAGNRHAAVAGGHAWIAEAEAPDVAERPGITALVICHVCGAVFDQRTRDVWQYPPSHPDRRISEEVDHDDRACPRFFLFQSAGSMLRGTSISANTGMAFCDRLE